MVDSGGVRWLVVAKRDDLTLADLGWGRLVGFGGGVVVRVLALPEVVYPVGLFGIDIGLEGLCDCFDGAFSTAICLLVKSGRWHEVNIKSFVKFSKEIGYKLGSSIRDDFLGCSVIAVDLTYECIDDVSGCVFRFPGH